ncbi:MAG TPA: ABC transporter permease [Actinocatenispora sp.]
MLTTALLRVDPRRSGAVVERNVLVHRRGWVVLLSGFFEPFLYLLALGIGLGQLVGQVPAPGGGTVPYPVFVAPAMLAVQAMNAALTETTFNVFGKLKYMRLYDAVLATPVTPTELALGEIGWCLARSALYSAAFLGVMAALGLTPSWWAVLAWPAALLIGFAFAALGMALTTFLRSWQDFDYVIVIMMVMFMFAGTFTPLSAYPTWVRPLVELTPLYHGVAITRALTTGALGWPLLGHLAYLVASGAVGLWIAARRMGRLLLP